MVTLQNTLSSDEFEDNANDVIIYTTPEDRDNINIRLNSFFVNNDVELEIFNIIGNKMYTQDLRGQKSTLSIGLPNLTSGVYIARLNFEGKQLTRKFFVY